MKKLSISEHAHCKTCSERYEVAGTTEQDGDHFPWLVVIGDVSSAQDALKQATCQVCLARSNEGRYQDGYPSLRSVLERLGTEMTEAKAMPTTGRPKRRFAMGSGGGGAQRPASRFATSDSSKSSGRPASRFATGKPRSGGGGRKRPKIAVGGPKRRTGGKPKVYTAGPDRTPRSKPSRVDGGMGDALHASIVKALAEHAPGTTRHDSAIEQGISLGVSHPAITKEIARRARRANSAFAGKMGGIKKLLAKCRALSLQQDVTDLVDDLRTRIDAAIAMDPKKRSKAKVLEMLGTSKSEIGKLYYTFWEGRTVAPDPEGSIGKDAGLVKPLSVPDLTSTEVVFDEPCAVWMGDTLKRHTPSTTIVLSSHGHDSFPEANAPLGQDERPVRKIRYVKGQEFGPNPFLVIDGDEHAFNHMVNLDGTPTKVTMMGKGTFARMSRHEESEWLGYVPHWVYHPRMADHPGKEPVYPMVNVGAAGFITLEQAQQERLEAESDTRPSDLDPNKSIILRFMPIEGEPYAELWGQLRSADPDSRMLKIRLPDNGEPSEHDSHADDIVFQPCRNLLVATGELDGEKPVLSPTLLDGAAPVAHA